jgi:two-component system NtrC family sensor kinase
MVLFAFVNHRTLKDLWLHEAVKDVDNLSETIIRTTYYQMLEDDRARVFQVIQEVADQEGIEHIRLINKDGRIAYSTESSEIGALLDKDAAACNVCHRSDTPLEHATSMSRSRIFREGDGEEILGLAKGIYSQPECESAACHAHPADVKLLGVLDVTVSLSAIKARMNFYRESVIAFTILLLLVLFVCLTCLTRRFVTTPVKDLLRQTHRLSHGELEGRIETGARDEIGELGEAFNEMTDNLRKAHAELRQWAETLEAKVAERSREIEQIQQQLLHSEKLASLGGLVAGIAHEVNNPLTGIMMFSSLALKNPTLPPPLQKDLQTVVCETQRCAEIVRGLLEFSRQSQPLKKEHSVNVLLDTTLALVEHQPRFHDIKIVRHYDATLSPVLVDSTQLRQVLMNLVLNAAQAMPGGGLLTVATGISLEKERLFIAIGDTGCGISEEHLPKIFDPFFTTKEHEGTGLGLSVSYGIVKSHGGEIEVQSRLGEGTRFTVLLPLGVPDEGRG